MIQLILLFLLGAFVPNIPAGQTADLQVTIEKTDSDDGKILVLVFKDPAGFPDQIENSFKQLTLKPKNGKSEFLLHDLPAGKYAITVLHDADENGEMTTSFVGIPQEKYGFSNNPKIYLGPPSFDKSAVQIGSENRKITINLR